MESPSFREMDHICKDRRLREEGLASRELASLRDRDPPQRSFPGSVKNCWACIGNDEPDTLPVTALLVPRA